MILNNHVGKSNHQRLYAGGHADGNRLFQNVLIKSDFPRAQGISGIQPYKTMQNDPG